MTLISVIIPAYNAEKTILQTVESVQKQSFTSIEIIVINDGSSDRTLQLLDTVKDDRLKVYSYPNGGVSVARNRGIAQATGEYISFIDADDLWTENKLEKQLATLQQHPEAGAAYSWMVCMAESEDDSENATFFPGRKVTFTGNIYPQLLLENFIGSGSNILAKRKAVDSIEGFNSIFDSCEDWDYYLRLAAKWSFILVPEHQIIYRRPINLETTTSKANIMQKKGLMVIEKAFQTAPPELQYLKNKSLARQYSYCSELYLNYSCDPINISKARQALWRSIRYSPSILLSKDIQLLTIRILFKQLIPPSVKNYLFSLLISFKSVEDPRG